MLNPSTIVFMQDRFQFGIIPQLPMPLVDHSFYQKTLYGAIDIPWPADVLLSFPPARRARDKIAVSCILPTHPNYTGDEQYSEIVEFRAVASLLFVLYGIPLHVRCLLVSDMENFNFQDRIATCPVLFDGRLFDGRNFPFLIRYDKSLLYRMPTSGPLNTKQPSLGTDHQLSICFLSTPFISDSEALENPSEAKESGCAIGISFDLECTFNRFFCLDNSSVDDQIQRVLRFGVIALTEIRRFTDMFGAIFEGLKISVRSNAQYFRILKDVVDQEGSLKIEDIETWDHTYDMLVHCLGVPTEAVDFNKITLENIHRLREWAVLLNGIDKCIKETKRHKAEDDPMRLIYSMPAAISGYISEETAAQRLYEAFAASERTSNGHARREHQIIEARVPCVHFLPPGFSLKTFCKCPS
ncbi:hypothetical protein TWF718_009967 [Orbilia javanica]|uniref:Uncharacterized protein n=1 Tax=Orbilia javanica TaxID=47235 RepID=A0AAN8MXN8_9PEZI